MYGKPGTGPNSVLGRQDWNWEGIEKELRLWYKGDKKQDIIIVLLSKYGTGNDIRLLHK